MNNAHVSMVVLLLTVSFSTVGTCAAGELPFSVTVSALQDESGKAQNAGLRLVQQCLKTGEIGGAIQTTELLALVNRASAFVAYSGLPNGKERTGSLEKAVASMLESNNTEVVMGLSLLCRTAQDEGELAPMIRVIETMKPSLTPDQYAFFHSGMIFLSGEKAAGLAEFSQITESFAKSVQAKHPASHGGF